MPTLRSDAVQALCAHPEERLRAVLSDAGVTAPERSTSRELSQILVDSLWWHYTTPLGYALDRVTLDQIVNHVAKRCQLNLPEGDAWSRARALALALAPGDDAVQLRDLHPTQQQRLRGSWLPASALGTGAASAAGARAVGKRVLHLTGGRVGRIAPFVPYVGPWFKTARKGAAVAATLGGPAAVALGALALNDALGTRYDRLLPLLLGLGRLGPGAHEAVVL